MIDFNIVSTKVDYNYNEPICDRAKLDTGTHCNYSCSFCYYKDKLDIITPFETIKERIDYLVKCNIKEVDLSGGESSIHADWFKILDYCKSNDLTISTLSNGSKFANKEFLQKSKEHGLEEILFSLHGYDEESHNKIVNHRNGFKNIIQSIHNAHDLGIKVRINCTVQAENYKELKTYTELIKELKPFELNFITLNYWDDAQNQTVIDYNLICDSIKSAIDELKDICLINVRYTPYCFMKGYEKYICNYYQHIYDIYDWNIALYKYDLDPEKYKKDKLKALYDSAKTNRLNTYYKKKECLGCKFLYICDGIEKQIKEIDLEPELSDDKITDPMYFRKGFYD